MAWPPDVSVPRAILVGLGVTVLLAVVVAASTSTTAFSLYNTGWEGTSDLRVVSQDAGATVRIADSTQAYEHVRANRTLAVILSPVDPYTGTDLERVRSFLQAGGTLLVAGDVGEPPNDLLAALGAAARVDGTILRDERNHYRGPALPIADTVTQSPLMAGVDQLTLNHGTAVDPNGATVLVATSPYAYLDANGDGDLDDTELMRTYPVVTREPIGAGTLVVVGDASVFINTMLDRPGNGAWIRTLAAQHDTVLLDTSHAAAIPPLAGVLLAVRDSVALQVLLAVVGLALVGAATHDGLRDRITARWQEDRVTPTLSERELTRVVTDRHPDWDAARVERVVEGIIRQRRQERDDD